MKFLGISIKDLSSSTKIAYVSIFAAIVIGAIYYGLSNLNEKQVKPSNKRRKSPKKTAWSLHNYKNFLYHIMFSQYEHKASWIKVQKEEDWGICDGFHLVDK